nr:hypothetical protein [Archangium sp.]
MGRSGKPAPGAHRREPQPRHQHPQREAAEQPLRGQQVQHVLVSPHRRPTPLQAPVLGGAVALEGEREGVQPGAQQRVLDEGVQGRAPDEQPRRAVSEVAHALYKGGEPARVRRAEHPEHEQERRGAEHEPCPAARKPEREAPEAPRHEHGQRGAEREPASARQRGHGGEGREDGEDDEAPEGPGPLEPGGALCPPHGERQRHGEVRGEVVGVAQRGEGADELADGGGAGPVQWIRLEHLGQGVRSHHRRGHHRGGEQGPRPSWGAAERAGGEVEERPREHGGQADEGLVGAHHGGPRAHRRQRRQQGRAGQQQEAERDGIPGEELPPGAQAEPQRGEQQQRHLGQLEGLQRPV